MNRKVLFAIILAAVVIVVSVVLISRYITRPTPLLVRGYGRVYDLSGFVENSGAHRSDARRAGRSGGAGTLLYALRRPK